MSTILVFGASGAVGRFLLPLLDAHRVIAVSRTPRAGWLCADLDDAGVSWPDADCVISLGPLDAFARWFERTRIPSLRRMIALSSMSVESKRDSGDAHERELAARLADAEARVLRVATERGIAATLFRPTLVYGAGVDRSLAPIARFAKRWRVLPVPFGATGLRQPVHARDLACACAAALDAAATHGKTYPLGGGERLSFAAMLARLREAVRGPVLIVPVPLTVLGMFAHRGSAFRAAAIARLRTSLVADNTAAARDFGYAPGAFAAHEVLPQEPTRSIQS